MTKPVRCPLHPRYWGICAPSRDCRGCDQVYINRYEDESEKLQRQSAVSLSRACAEMVKESLKAPSPWLSAIEPGVFPSGLGETVRQPDTTLSSLEAKVARVRGSTKPGRGIAPQPEVRRRGPAKP